MDTQNLYNSPFLATRIKEYAKSKGIVVKTLLEDCELGANAMSHLLHGRSISATSLARIADYLDCSVDYLLGRTDVPEINHGPVQEPTHLVKFAARAGGGIREVALTESQVEALKNLPEVPNLDEKKDKK